MRVDVSRDTGNASSEIDPRLAQELLAEYFGILREWSLSGRPDTGLAPDATEQP